MYTDPSPPTEPRLQRLPRSPVLGSRSFGNTAGASRWTRIDTQGNACFPTSGRVAILLALRAIGMCASDQMLVPTYHCPTMVEPCVRLGAQPLFYPIGIDGAPQLEALRALDTRRVKALIAAHLFGLPIDLRGLRRFCDERGIWMIEDCAHSYFGGSSIWPIGATGDFVIGSLPKFFPAVEGGCLVVRTPSLVLPRLNRPGFVAELRALWDCFELGAAAGKLGSLNAPMSALVRLKKRLRGASQFSGEETKETIEAAQHYSTIVSSRIELQSTATVSWAVRHFNVERSAKQRRSNYEDFARLLCNEKQLRPLFPTLPEGAVPYVFPLLVDDPESLYQALRRRGIPLYRWDIVWPGAPVLEGDAGASWSTRVFQLCCHEDMSVEDVQVVAGVIQQECRRSRR